MAPPPHRPPIVRRLAGGLLLGAGLAAIYWAPALAQLGHVSAQVLTQGQADVRQGFFFADFSLPIARDEFERGLFWIVLSQLLLAFCARLLVGNQESVRRRLGQFWWGVTVGSVFMMLPLSSPLYQIISPLRWIQFPWRFNTLLALSTTALLSLSLSRLPLVRSARHRIALSLAALLTLAWLPFTAQQIRRTGLASDWLLGRPLSPRQLFHHDTAEYRPRWAQADLEQTRANLRDPDGRPLRFRIRHGSGRVKVERWEPRHIRLRVQAMTNLTLHVGQLYYPGWTASTSNIPGHVQIGAADPTGLIQLVVPPGSSWIDLRLRPTGSERWGQWASGASLLLWIFGGRQRRQGQATSR